MSEHRLMRGKRQLRPRNRPRLCREIRILAAPRGRGHLRSLSETPHQENLRDLRASVVN